MPGRFVLLLTIALLTVFANGCGGDDVAPACAETLCQPTTSVCLGNSLATCGLDGKSWTVSPCSDGKCNSNTNSCELYKCKPLSQICGTDGTSYDRCPESGSGLTPGTCATNTTCVGGACVETACTTGDTRCGFRQVLTCVNDAWSVETVCSGSDVCVDGNPASCEAPECEPGSSTCEGDVAVTCDVAGNIASKRTCASNEVCQGGHCRSKICGVDDGESADATADAGASDSGPAQNTGPEVTPPPLEQVSKIDFKLGGTPQTFNLNARADYVSSTSTLKVSAGSGNRKVELNVGPIDPFVVGAFTDTDATEVVVTICYYDGVSEGQAPSCTVGFS
ncbi:MAG: hypothetical protein VX938_04200, partial [Myxococcota bacterium]|nr:hypothetical protein [Myxococcota bacterium]